MTRDQRRSRRREIRSKAPKPAGHAAWLLANPVPTAIQLAPEPKPRS